jgi:hypothetical protein
LLTGPTTALTAETTLSHTPWPATALACGSGLLGPKASSSIAKNGIGCTGATAFSALAGLAGGSPARSKLSGMALMPLMPVGSGDRNSLQLALDFSAQGHGIRRRGGVPICSVGEKSLLYPSVTAIPLSITAEPRNFVAKESSSQGETASAAANGIAGAFAVLEAPGMPHPPTALLEHSRADFMLSAADVWKEQGQQQREEDRMRRVHTGATAEDNDELKRRLVTIKLQADLHAREAEAAQRQESQRSRECQEAQERQVALDKHQQLELERKQQQQLRLHRGLGFLSNAHSASEHGCSNDTDAAPIVRGRGHGDAQGSADDARGVVRGGGGEFR